MIMLDTHIWIWLVNSPSKLTEKQLEFIQSNIGKLMISIVSVWEVVMLEHKKRLDFGVPLQEWLDDALYSQNIGIIGLSIDICIESYALPDNFHADPMDRMIVATARKNHCKLVIQLLNTFL